MEKAKKLTGFEILQRAAKDNIKGKLITTHKTGAETREYEIDGKKYKVRAAYTQHTF